MEGWDFRFALYFCIVVVTTIGYGDNDPFEQDASLFFTSLFVLFGVGVIFAAISILLAAAADQRKAQANTMMKEAVQSLLGDKGADKGAELDAHGNPKPVVVVAATPRSVRMFKEAIKFCRYNHMMNTFLQLILVQTVGILYATQTENMDSDTGIHMTFVQAFYWTVITGTTVGFGDYSAESDEAQWFAIFYLLPLVVITGNFLQAIAGLLAGGPDLKKLLKRGLDEDLIKEFDISGDGEVDKGEWLRAFLVAMGKADADLCDIILEQFDILDASGDGSLSTDDILLATNLSKQKSTSVIRQRQEDRTTNLLARAGRWGDRQTPVDPWRVGIHSTVGGAHPHETFAM